ncbi:hypothetical protein [uncultured Bacteroides sp.]|uniref:hypothetical protein n=1 Tax=uncultured Bacteroides sp. TaxID=162156 RepID=UPI00263261B0|nr:hypothetical protein [uncultured Bacteroides sp.]
MKKFKLAEAYKVLNNSSTKVTKMEENDKFVVIDIIMELKPISEEISEAIDIAREKLKGEHHDEFMAKVPKWEELSDEEKIEINAYLFKYNKSIEDSIANLVQEEVELTKKLSKEAFKKFWASNDFDVPTIVMLSEVLC